METQWDLLIPNLRDPERFALVKQNTELIPSGSSPCSVGTLKVGLRKIIELKRKKREPPGVKLRYSNCYCPSYNNHLSYSSITKTTHHCQWPNGSSYNWYFQCVGCGINREGDHPSGTIRLDDIFYLVNVNGTVYCSAEIQPPVRYEGWYKFPFAIPVTLCMYRILSAEVYHVDHPRD